MKKQINHSYFPKGLRYSTPLVFAGGIYLLTLQRPIWSALILLVGVIILTTKYVTEISLIEKAYKDYLFLLGLKLDYEAKNFKAVDRIIITKGNFSQNLVPPRGSNRTMKWSVYTGTVIFDNGNLDLLTISNKKELWLS